jgi:hypothetical protein
LFVVSFGTEFLFWMILPILVAIGSAYVVWLLMQSRIQVLTAHYQAAVAKMENDPVPRRLSPEDLLADLRMERRRFVRRVAGARGPETTLITQERLYLRNLPLTSWMQEEVPLGAGEELPAGTGLIPLLEATAPPALPLPPPAP